MSGEESLSWMLLRWRADPVACCIEAFRVIPMLYQAQILCDLFDAPQEVYDFYGLVPDNPKRAVLMPSGHGVGKTRVEALAIWQHKITRRFSKQLCTAPSADQLTGQLWGECRKMYRRLKSSWPMLAEEWDILAGSIVHKDPQYGDWITIGRTARPDNPEALQGGHSLDADDEFGQLAELFNDESTGAPAGGILIIFEEASGIVDVIRETLQGSLSEPGAMLLAAGNPTRPDGWFADDMDRTDRYSVQYLDCRMSDRTKVYELPYRDTAGRTHLLKARGFVDPKYWQGILEDEDGDDDTDRVRVRVRGMKPRSATEQCIRSHWVDAAVARPEDAESKAEAPIIGLDFGVVSDKHALAVRQGYNQLEGQEWLPPDRPEDVTLQAADRAIEAQTLYGAKFIVGDANGVGRGAMEYLARYYHAQHKELNVVVIFFNSGEGARDGSRYHRRRDEMWHKRGRNWLASPRCHLLDIPGQRKQLGAPGYTEGGDRIIRVESKKDIYKRLGEPSGNLADALLQTLMVETPVSFDTKPPAPKKAEPEGVVERHLRRWKRGRVGGHLIR